MKTFVCGVTYTMAPVILEEILPMSVFGWLSIPAANAYIAVKSVSKSVLEGDYYSYWAYKDTNILLPLICFSIPTVIFLGFRC